jgi:hypothetical protein
VHHRRPCPHPPIQVRRARAHLSSPPSVNTSLDRVLTPYLACLSPCRETWAYHPSLTPMLSPLRPHCLAKDWLCLWLPSSSSSQGRDSGNRQDTPSISKEQLHRILDVIDASWTEKTKETYGTGLLVFHVYCDIHCIPESSRCPTTQPLLSVFLASCTRVYSGSTLSNFTASICAWHVLHIFTWAINQSELCALLEGAAHLTPLTSKCAKCIPFECNINVLRYFPK